MKFLVKNLNSENVVPLLDSSLVKFTRHLYKHYNTHHQFTSMFYLGDLSDLDQHSKTTKRHTKISISIMLEPTNHNIRIGKKNLYQNQNETNIMNLFKSCKWATTAYSFLNRTNIRFYMINTQLWKSTYKKKKSERRIEI